MTPGSVSFRPAVEKVRAIVSMRSHLTIVALLFPLYAALGVAAYWLFVDVTPPLIVEYQHPRFLSRPVESRSEAVTAEITEAKSGAVVWIWRETCKTRAIGGEGRPVWQSGAFQWGGPQRTLPPGVVGCRGRATEVDVPTTSPSREFTYLLTVNFQLNPLTSVDVVYPPINVRVLAPEK